MLRVLFAFLLTGCVGLSQNLPAFRWAEPIDNASGGNRFAGLGTDAQGNTYVVGSTRFTTFPVQSGVQSHLAGGWDVFVTELDPAGNVVYSTFFGGSGDDIATAMTVDSAGNVYVTGTTTSTNFPTTPGTYAASFAALTQNPYPIVTTASFLFKLNAGGSVGYSTYFTSTQTTPSAITVDSMGSAYLTGTSYGGLPTTPGAYRTILRPPTPPGTVPLIVYNDGFVTRFDASGAKLVYSTYVGDVGGILYENVGSPAEHALAVSPTGAAYIGGNSGVRLFDPTGSSLIAAASELPVQALALAPDGSVYMAGAPNIYYFQTTVGAFQPNPRLLTFLPLQGAGSAPAAIVKMDSQIQNVLAATYFGGGNGTSASAIMLDAAGNVYLGGQTSPLDPPTRTPFARGFGVNLTGFVAELTGDLSTLIFSSDFGDNETFGVNALAIGSNGSFILGGNTGLSQPLANQGAIWVNSVVPAPPPALRIDSVVNAASQLSMQMATGETIAVIGAGFGADAQLTYDGVVVPTISISPTEITALAPVSTGEHSGYTAPVIQVLSGGAASNPVLVSGGAIVAPGLFSADGSGIGQGYILNQDGTLNTPSNPAATGDKITVFATGVGPVSFSDGYAVTQSPVSLYMDGIYCPGVAAVMGPVAGFPGDVYQLTMQVPTVNGFFPLPPLVPVTLQILGVSSQQGLAISIAQ